MSYRRLSLGDRSAGRSSRRVWVWDSWSICSCVMLQQFYRRSPPLMPSKSIDSMGFVFGLAPAKFEYWGFLGLAVCDPGALGLESSGTGPCGVYRRAVFWRDGSSRGDYRFVGPDEYAIDGWAICRPGFRVGLSGCGGDREFCIATPLGCFVTRSVVVSPTEL
jgi:hypothetical protein